MNYVLIGMYVIHIVEVLPNLKLMSHCPFELVAKKMKNYFNGYFCAIIFVFFLQMVYGQIDDVSRWKEDIDTICNTKRDLPDQYLEHLCSFLKKVPNDQTIMMDFLEHLVTARNYSEAKSDALELFLKSMISLLEPNGIIFLYSGKMKGTCM